MARKKVMSSETREKIFPTRLRKLMCKEKVTQEQLGKAIGITRQAISLYINGQSTPDIEVFQKIADFFGVPADYLLGRVSVETECMILQEVCEYTGLSEEAITAVADYFRKGGNEGNMKVLSDLICGLVKGIGELGNGESNNSGA